MTIQSAKSNSPGNVPVLAPHMTAPPHEPQLRSAWRKHLRFYISIFALVFTTNLGGYLSDLPLVRLFERKICRDYLGSIADENEAACKIPSVQDRLAYITELKPAFDSIPALLLSFWYASLADRWGRRPIIVLNCLGEALALMWILFVCFTQVHVAPEALWLAAIFSFIGGGPHVLSALFYTTIADVVSAEERARILSLTYAVIFSTSIVAPILAASIMANLYVPFVIVFATITLRLVLVWVLPETAPSRPKYTRRSSGDETSHRRSNEENVPSQSSHSTESLTHTPTEAIDYRQPSAQMLIRIRHMLRLSQLQFCFVTMLFKRVAFSSEALLYQYASDVLNTKLSNTAWLRSLQAVGATIATAASVPLATYLLIKVAHQPASSTSLFIVQASLAILTLGFVALWLGQGAASIGIATFLCGSGEGLSPSVQALALNAITSLDNAALFASLGVVDTLGKLIGGPVMAFLFSIRDTGGHSIGYCFSLSAILFGGLLVLSGFLPRSNKA